MVDMHVKYRQLILLAVATFVVLLILSGYHSGRKCKQDLLDDLPGVNDRLQQDVTIYAITPTYARPVQRAELYRLAQTFLLLPNVHWIIIEDSETITPLVTDVINRFNLKNRATQLNAKTPNVFKRKETVFASEANWLKPRGVEQRNTGLAWLRSHLHSSGDGRHSVVYFCDDDNTYSVFLFAEMTRIERGRVGVWPVGLVGGLLVEKPLLDADHRVTGFNSAWHPERPFPVDMAGFAISTDLMVRYPEAVFSYDVQRGYQESEILRHVTKLQDLQPLANLCTEVFVWHTRTEAPVLKIEMQLQKTGKSSATGVNI